MRAIDRVLTARDKDRPKITDYIDNVFTDFFEQKGDYLGKEDASIYGGIALFHGRPVTVIGHRKGNDVNENVACNFGMPGPEGYRKALRMMKQAEKFNRPIITFVDTPGAYPGISAEETNQGGAIAVNLRDMAKLKVPVIAIITGEGCSGGALGLAVANRVFLLEHSYYTVISPEGCASILWRDASKASEAAQALKITSKDLLKLGLIDGEIEEPIGGAHHDYKLISENMKKVILDSLKELNKLSPEKLKSERYDKFRKMGKFIEN